MEYFLHHPCCQECTLAGCTIQGGLTQKSGSEQFYRAGRCKSILIEFEAGNRERLALCKINVNLMAELWLRFLPISNSYSHLFKLLFWIETVAIKSNFNKLNSLNIDRTHIIEAAITSHIQAVLPTPLGNTVVTFACFSSATTRRSLAAATFEWVKPK